MPLVDPPTASYHSQMPQIGLGLPGSASPPAEDERRKKMVYDTGFACANLLETGIRPRDILSFEHLRMQ